jgi:hypothetical protein
MTHEPKLTTFWIYLWLWHMYTWLLPRKKHRATHSLDEFAKLNPSVDLVQGAEMELTIRGDTLLYKNALGGVGRIHSAVFTKALCDVYYGNDAVSAPHRDAVLDGVSKL